VLAAHVETAESASLFVDARVYVAPAQVPGLDRAHAGGGHNEDEEVDDGAVPLLFLVLRLVDPLSRVGMQVAVLLRGEGFSARLGVQDFPFGDAAVREEVLVGGIAQNGTEGDQFMADGSVLHRFTARTLA